MKEKGWTPSQILRDFPASNLGSGMFALCKRFVGGFGHGTQLIVADGRTGTFEERSVSAIHPYAIHPYGHYETTYEYETNLLPGKSFSQGSTIDANFARRLEWED